MISDYNLLDPQTESIVGGSTIGILSFFGFSLSLWVLSFYFSLWCLFDHTDLLG